MAVEQILKSWLRQKYTDNNTLKDRYKQEDPVNSGDTLVVPDTSNSLADDVDINTLVTSLRKMQGNVYLRHSSLWDSVDVSNVTEGALILQNKKSDVDDLVTDLLAMCANYSKTLCAVYSNNPVANFTRFDTNARFSQNSGNASFGFNHSNLKFTFNRTNSSNGFNSTNGRCTQNSARCSKVSGRVTYTKQLSNISFTQNSGNSSNGNNTNKVSGGGFFQDNDSTSFGFFSSNVSSFSQNSTNLISFTQCSTNFSQRFNQSFIVKSDGSTIDYVNLVD